MIFLYRFILFRSTTARLKIKQMKLLKFLFSIFLFKALVLAELEASTLVKNNFDIIFYENINLKGNYLAMHHIGIFLIIIL